MAANERNESVEQRQAPLRETYQQNLDQAMIQESASNSGANLTDPYHGSVQFGDGSSFEYGIHQAVSGHGDKPTPEQLFCAALAACQEASIRMVANILGVELTELKVMVTASVDVRGTLLVEKSVPVGFQSMECQVQLKAADGTEAALLDKLMSEAERSCIVLQTLRDGIDVKLSATN
jgi:organic hydroperoxide reductase OsmC/OhrA